MTSYSRSINCAAGACAVLLLAACGKPDSAGRQPLGEPGNAAPVAQQSGASTPALPLAAIAALDAGNEAYRARKFDDALVKYREAAAAAPEHAAPWFGLYMVANELKNSALADSAMRRVKALSADPEALGAHAEVTSAGTTSKGGAALPGHPDPKALPPGHPSTQPLPAGHPPTVAPTSPPKGPAPVKRGATQ